MLEIEKILNMSHTKQMHQEKKILHEFRNVVSDILKPEHNDEYLLRWLRARDFDVKKAEKMIRKSFKFMHNVEAENILNNGYEVPKLATTYVPTQFWGVNAEGYPIRSLYLGLMDFKGLARTFHLVDWVKYVIYKIESDMEYAKQFADKINGERRQKVCFVFDFEGFNIRQVFDTEVFRVAAFIMTMYQDNFPELLEVLYIINGPPMFQTVINMFRPFVNERTWRKIRIFSSNCWKEEFLDTFDTKIIPKSYGGELEERECDPTSFLETTNGGKLPLNFYRKHELYLKGTELGILAIAIQRRSEFQHVVNVPEQNTMIKWVFQTKDYDIRFGIVFRKSQEFQNEAFEKEVLASQIVDSHVVPERGEILCEEAGKYILCFDNTYSWIIKKLLFLKVEVGQLEY